jgi:peptide methionine sulfoxide reductase MsrB
MSSFYAAVDPAHVIERVDPRDKDYLPQFLWRVEVLDRKSGTHLGHVFEGTTSHHISLMDIG